ncbi:MAG: glycosyltransferase family 2 protein [Cryomorphaceae bacterium]
MESISVVIPSYNEAKALPALIKLLSKQSFQPSEIIVVLDGCTDNSFSVLSEISLSTKSLKIATQENKGRAAARNAGAKLATGKYLLFLDSDMVPETDLVSKHLYFLDIYPESIIAGNQIEPFVHNEHDFLKFKACRRREWIKPYNKNVIRLAANNIFLTAANCSMSKNTFEGLGGFDERLTDAEDFDMAMRAMENEISVIFVSDLIAWHKDPALAGKTIRRMREYRKAHLRLENMKPELVRKYNKYTITAPKGFKRIAFIIFSRPKWVDYIDNEKLLILPKSLRYRIYSYVLAALGNYNRDVSLHEN